MHINTHTLIFLHTYSYNYTYTYTHTYIYLDNNFAIKLIVMNIIAHIKIELCNLKSSCYLIVILSKFLLTINST